MKGKERQPLVRPATILFAGLFFNVAGGVLIATAAHAYSENIGTAHLAAEERDAWRLPPECDQVQP